MTAVDKKR